MNNSIVFKKLYLKSLTTECKLQKATNNLLLFTLQKENDIFNSKVIKNTSKL